MPKHAANAHHRRPLKLVVVFKSAGPLEQKRQREKEHSSRLAKECGTYVSRGWQSIAGDERARMRWNAYGFYAHVARKYAVCLLSWPSDLLFTNLSRVRGGLRTMRELSCRIDSGILKFVAVPLDQAKELTVESAAPGKFIPRPPRAVRRDYGKHKVLVEDSDAYESEEDDIQSVGSWEAAAEKGSEVENVSAYDA
ncbi:hypothetical protein FOMPIDRAFT_1020746 [Fomitopsis schrenkii]|uniref:Uncharacterized protein n=1 Tax=Fomitopsis schrenkii TaxID=2126942 RepID=S8DP72_FOMSC|nr:hypothetical protein FOMPIDRAFT_1020746 [Fomitopsis schrenkii]